MIVMAALLYLPIRLVGAFGLAMIVLHNLLDVYQVPPNIAFATAPPPDIWQALWMILHQPGVIPVTASSDIFIAYPLIPWIGVMAAGYAFGTIYSWAGERRRKWLLISGAAVCVLFVLIRLVNVYGDPARWAPQDTPAFTFLSFLNTTKYPPSLLYLLMTLGPAILVLALADRIDGKAVWQRIGIVFDRDTGAI